MKKPVISVIVPVWNVEKYLSQCLDSILCQTFSNFELICVNDGSTDNSRKILEKYQLSDSRIKIVNKKNGGLSSARNAGMKVAQGDFYSFIDSDDWVAPDMLEKLYDNISKFNSDIAFCKVHQFNEAENKIDDSNPYYTLDYFDETFDNRAFSYKDTKPFIMDVCVTAWNKLYRKSFIDKCNAWFPEGLIFEDGPFFFSIFFKAERISLVRDFLYYYRINRKGSIIDKAGKKFLNLIDVINIMYEKASSADDFEDFKYDFYKKKVEDVVYRYENLKFKYRYLFAKRVKKCCALNNEEVFPKEAVRGNFKYMWLLFVSLKSGNVFNYNFFKYKLKAMYKLMEVLYTENDIYYLKYKNKVLKLKKQAEILDMYYNNDRLFIIFFNKIKVNFKFKYSSLEKLNEDG